MKIGFWELIVIVIVAFVFIGPDQLPVYAKKIGKMLRELKKYTGAASEEIQKNVVELPEQPAEAPAETVEAPAEKPEQAAAEAAQPAAEPVAEPVQEAPAAAEAAPAEEAKV